MNKLQCRPDQASFSAADPDNRISSSFGLAGRHRRNLFNASREVNVTWQASRRMYNILSQAYRAFIASGGDAFLIDLIIGNTSLVEYETKFVAGSFKLSAVKGQTFYIAAKLNVKPAEYDVKSRSWISDSGLQRIVAQVANSNYLFTPKPASFRPTTRRIEPVAGAFVLEAKSALFTRASPFAHYSGSTIALTVKSVGFTKISATLAASVGNAAFILSGKSVQITAPSSANIKLREDGGNRLREDGSLKLRES